MLGRGTAPGPDGLGAPVRLLGRATVDFMTSDHLGSLPVAGDILPTGYGFGLGAPLVAMVGTCIGAGQRERALRATWIGAAMAFVMAEAIGLWAAASPNGWLSLFNSDPAMLEAGALYLRTVGPVYGFFGLGLVLYFASQGAGRLLWPVIGNIVRLAVAVTGGSVAVREEGEVDYRCSGGLFCSAQRKQAILHFAQRRAVEVEGLGEKLVDLV
eukprot:gene17849-24933_t